MHNRLVLIGVSVFIIPALLLSACQGADGAIDTVNDSDLVSGEANAIRVYESPT